jgi:hypothetical protein
LHPERDNDHDDYHRDDNDVDDDSQHDNLGDDNDAESTGRTSVNNAE